MGGDMMEFPDTVEEFMQEYKMVDKHEIYSNGTEYVPIFRMEQWFEHCRAIEKITQEDIDYWHKLSQSYAHTICVMAEAIARKGVKHEVVHGEWIKDVEASKETLESIYVCSACHNFEAWGETEKYNYCPNCGARMDGEV